MLREAAIALGRPILAVTPLAAEAEALAQEVAFFLGETMGSDTPSRRVHLLPAWELKPFAHLSPPHDAQAAQMAALFSMRRAATTLGAETLPKLSRASARKS